MSGNPSYAELLSRPFHEGLANTWITQGPENGDETLRRCSQSVLELAGGVDWAAYDLPGVSIGTKVMAPSEYGPYLAEAALEDAQNMMVLCEQAVGYTDGLPADFDIQAAMLASTGSLLAPVVNELADHHKSNLRISVQVPDLSLELMGINFVEAPILIYSAANDENVLKFRWSKQVASWLERNKNSERGCPAHKIMVDEDGHQIPLTYYLWNKLVVAKYGQTQE